MMILGKNSLIDIENFSYDKNIYFKGKILEGVDYNTFEVLPNGDGKDKNRSYEYLPKDEWRWF